MSHKYTGYGYETLVYQYMPSTFQNVIKRKMPIHSNAKKKTWLGTALMR